MSHNSPQTKEVITINETVILVESQFYRKHDHETEELKIIGHLAQANRDLTKIIDRLLGEEKRQKPIFALTTFLNNQLFIMADIVLTLGTSKNGIFTLLDNKTLQPIAGVSFSNQAVGVNTNPGAATFAIDPANPNTPVGTPIAAGSGSVVFSTDANYVDPGDGSTNSASFSVTKNFTVVASADGVTLDVVFS